MSLIESLVYLVVVLIKATQYSLYVRDETNWPTDEHLRIVSTREARRIFGPRAARMEGVTFMSTDPCQFLTQ